MTCAVAVIVLAAGRGARFAPNRSDTKITAEFLGTPLVRHVVETALRSPAALVVVVSGDAHDQIVASLSGLDVRVVHNADCASGVASSIKAGLATVHSKVDGVLIMLGDMPLVRAETLAVLMQRFTEGEVDAVIPTFNAQRGNPVLVGRSLFARLEELRGDEGARRILTSAGLSIAFCEVPDRGVLVDVDTRADLAALGG